MTWTAGDFDRYDIAVIGGGVVGCAVLRAAALNGLRAVLLERGADILSGASKGNSGILHTGFDAPPGSLELALMQEGRREYLAVREALGLPLLETDAVLVAWTAEEAAKLPAIVAKAHANGVPGVRPLALDELRRRHPHLSSTAVAALLVPGEHVIDPWSAPLAYALQAIANGATIERNAEVTRCERHDGGWRLHHARGVVERLHRRGVRRQLRRPCRSAGRARRRSRSARARASSWCSTRPRSRLMPTIVLPVPTERTKGVVLCPHRLRQRAHRPHRRRPGRPRGRERRHRHVAPACGRRRAHGRRRWRTNRSPRSMPACGRPPIPAAISSTPTATERWITVAGIRSTGLTAAPGIAAHVLRLVAEHLHAAGPAQRSGDAARAEPRRAAAARPPARQGAARSPACAKW